MAWEALAAGAEVWSYTTRGVPFLRPPRHYGSVGKRHGRSGSKERRHLGLADLRSQSETHEHGAGVDGGTGKHVTPQSLYTLYGSDDTRMTIAPAWHMRSGVVGSHIGGISPIAPCSLRPHSTTVGSLLAICKATPVKSLV